MHISRSREEKRKYNSAAVTPFVVSTDGMLGREANFLLKRLAQSISIKWDKPLGQTQDGCAQSFLLQYFEQQIFACVVLRPSGEAELEWIIVLGYQLNYQI